MSKKRDWVQGEFTPKFPEKCMNLHMKSGKLPYARSSWEFKMFHWCDENRNVLRWGSEIIKIPYIFDMDKIKGIHKTHMYYPDIYCEVYNKQGKLNKFLIEIKPDKQKNKPTKPKTKTKKAMANYLYAVNEYVKNKNKWKYAKMFCEGKDWKFKILTENNIFTGE